MPKLTVYFNGIVGFTEDFTRALMVHRPQATIFDPGGGKKPISIPGHSAYLRLPHRDVDPESAKQLTTLHRWDALAMKNIFDEPGRIATYLRFLNHHQIELPQASEAHKVETGSMETHSKSVEWVASMKELGGTATKIDPRYLDDANPSEELSAFVRMTSGVVSTAIVSDYKFAAVKPSDINAKAGLLDRSVAQLVQWELTAPDPIVVTCTHYGKDGSDDTFTIRYKSGLAKSWLMIGASALEDLFQLSTVDKGVGEPDYHFRLLYDLFAEKPHDDEVLLPIGIVDKKPDRELGAPRCVPIKP